jgi:hypothetical protein
MNTTQIISAKILIAQANGMELSAAIDHVLGAGTYDKMVSDLYDTLRASK